MADYPGWFVDSRRGSFYGLGFMIGQVFRFFLESLILAQDERWRRA